MILKSSLRAFSVASVSPWWIFLGLGYDVPGVEAFQALALDPWLAEGLMPLYHRFCLLAGVLDLHEQLHGCIIS